MASRADTCVKCGESRGAIRNERLICWDGYDELGKHRFKPWPDIQPPTLEALPVQTVRASNVSEEEKR